MSLAWLWTALIAAGPVLHAYDHWARQRQIRTSSIRKETT